MKKLSTLALGLLAGLTMNVVLAQTPPPRSAPGEQPASLKPLTRADALAMAAKRFDAADTNKDGVLTQDEMKAAHAARRGPPPRDGAQGEHKGPPPPRDGAHCDRKGPSPPQAGAQSDHKGPPPPRDGAHCDHKSPPPARDDAQGDFKGSPPAGAR